MFPSRYRAESLPIELGTTNSSLKDRSPKFWEVECETVASHFDRKVKQRIEVGDIEHLSVFGLAPQPLLVLLGTLLNNIVPADIYHRHREPRQTWDWPNEGPTHELLIKRPGHFDGSPALVIGLTANVIDDRVNSVLGASACIWTVTTPQPRHDLIRSREDLSNFRAVIRELLDEIKDRHGLTTLLHIFPVAGNSISIELGRARMPKVMMPWTIYDHVNEQSGFVPAITIP